QEKKIMELPHDLMEQIFERLPVKSLLRFKSVSKRWKSTIESPNFNKRHLICRQLQDPEILLLDYRKSTGTFRTRTFVVGSSDASNPSHLLLIEPDKFANKTTFDFEYMYTTSFDGLICIYEFRGYIFIANPSIRWYRDVPQASLQAILLERNDGYEPSLLGFGKDICTGTYKLILVI
ncbi:hypothetical protein EUTSA_v10028258mg, partial [Eutrema salsugineum]